MLNIHMLNVHQESPHDRITRVTDTVKNALYQESIKRNTDKNVKSFDCTECGELFENNQEQTIHNQKVHASGLIPNIMVDKKQDLNKQIVCDLCDKVFPNRVQKSNHTLLVHTVREEKIKCDFCSEAYIGLKEICKHISHKHSELFPKRNKNECTMCNTKFDNKEDLNNHIDKKLL